MENSNKTVPNRHSTLSPQSSVLIKVVFFDIGNVLLKFNAREIAAKFAWAVRSHPLKIIRYLWSSKIGVAVERGELSSRALFALFRDELGYQGSFAEFKALWCDHFTLNRPTFDILRAVAKRRRVYLLSNTNALHYDFIRRRYAFPRYAHGAILSYKLKLRKPEPEIFQAALDRARVKAEEAFFIDDLRENVQAARRLGIRSHLFRDSETLQAELQALGVLG